MALIDLTSLTKIGNMTSGGGLPGVFDGNIATTGYRTSTTGYSGVQLASPTSISKVEIVSPSNGFDASGSTTLINLQVYGKVGSAPVNGTDGVLLGSTGNFTDINAVTTKTVIVSNPATFDYVWVNSSTGVWAIAAEIRIYDNEVAPPPPPPVFTDAPKISRVKVCNVSTPINWYAAEIQDFRHEFYNTNNSVATLSFRANVIHNNVFQGAVGISARIFYRKSTDYNTLSSLPWINIPNAVSGQNIVDVTDHYGNIDIYSKMSLEANNYYQFAVRMSAHSTGSSSDGLCSVLVENGEGLNSFIITKDDSEVLA